MKKTKKILSVILSVLVVLSVLSLTAFLSFAAETPTYIASIGIAQDGSSGSTGVNDCKSELSGHTIIDRDLNDGAGGDYVYMGYKTTTDPSKAITGILFRVGENPPDRITDNGKAYFYLVGKGETNTASEGGYIDLNAKAGGDYIYMYVTRDTSYGAPLTAITVDENSSKTGYETATNNSGSVIDLNQGAGGNYLYLHYKRFSETVKSTYHYLDANGNRTNSTQSATVKNHLETMTKVPSYPTSVTYDGRTFVFKGWREDNTAGAATVTSPSATYITGDKTYRAVYSANVKLSYDANGGSGAPSAQSATQYINAGSSSVAKQSVQFTISKNTYTHPSKCFIGLSSDKSATTAAYQPGGNISISSNTTLYAVYADHSYSGGICDRCGAYIPDAVAVLSKNGKDVFAGNTLDAVITEAEKCTAADKAVMTILQDIDLGSNYQEIDSGVFTIDLNGCTLSGNDFYTLCIYNSGTDIALISSRTGGTVESKNMGAIYMGSNLNLTATGIRVSAENGVGINLQGRGAKLTLTNCTVQAAEDALYVYSKNTATVTGGSLTGGDYDVAGGGSVTLADTTFPDGIRSMNNPLNESLAEGYAYWAGDTMLSVGDNIWSITDKGDITVKAVCTHESGTKQNYSNKGDNHSFIWTCCKLEATEDHSFTNTKCVCGARDHDCVYTNGFCKKDCYQPAELVDGYYQITNGGNLFWFAEYINTVDRTANAKLTADINLENRAWTPIGSTGEGNNNFRGHFDGQGYTITGLYAEGGRSGLGFFGEVRLGTVENFTIYGEVKLIGKYDYVGGVIGSAPGVNSDVPDHNGATIRNITSYVNVTLGEGSHGSNRVGGFIGYANHETLIENCSWYGTLDLGPYRAQDGVGGLVGKANDNSAVTIRNCGAYGTIKTSYQSGSYNSFDTIYIGGIVSNSVSSAQTNIENTLWAGNIINETNLGEKAHISAFGTLNGIGSVTNCYALDNAPYITTNGTHDSYITTVTDAQLASGEVAYKLGEAWGQSIGSDTHPIPGGRKVYYGYADCTATEMTYANTPLSETVVAHSYENGCCTVCDGYEPANGSGTEADPYKIGNAGQLYWFAAQVNGGNISAWAELTDNIVVNENVLKADGTLNEGTYRDWTPIGIISNRYTGTFDGKGKTVSGLYFNDSTVNHVGLFGYLQSGGIVQNVGVVDSYLSGNEKIGGVVGVSDGTITDCYNNGTISGNTSVGGVVGFNNGDVIAGCYNTGTVSGDSDVGGVAGGNYTIVTDCYNTGSISGDIWIGGVVGKINNGATVTDSYNTGSVSGNTDVGGVVGISDGTITDCYNAGTVSSNSNAGGVAGRNYVNGTITNCYYDSTVYSGNAIGTDIVIATDVEGKTTEQFASGEVAYLLGDAFGQDLDNGKPVQEYPTFTGAKVYQVLNCKNEVAKYSNTNETLGHDWSGNDGICAVCDLTAFTAVNGAVVNCENGIIFGLDAGITSVDSYFNILVDGAEWEYELGIFDQFGSGTKAILKDGDNIIAEYTILIYGDINGDSWYDGEDAFLVNLIVKGMLKQHDLPEYMWMAADCNHDGVIDETDVDLLMGAGVRRNDIDQNSSLSELQLQAAYIEYASLIDQSAGLDVESDEDTDDTTTPDTNEPETPDETEELTFSIVIIKIFTFIRKVLNLVFSFIVK